MFNVYLLCTLHQSLWGQTKDRYIVLLASLQPCIVTYYWHCIVWIPYNTLQYIILQYNLLLQPCIVTMGGRCPSGRLATLRLRHSRSALQPHPSPSILCARTWAGSFNTLPEPYIALVGPRCPCLRQPPRPKTFLAPSFTLIWAFIPWQRKRPD